MWFRGSNDEIQRHRDGLMLDGQGLSPLVLGVAKLLPASSRADGDQFWVKQTRTVHTATAAAYGVITATVARRPAPPSSPPAGCCSASTSPRPAAASPCST